MPMNTCAALGPALAALVAGASACMKVQMSAQDADLSASAALDSALAGLMTVASCGGRWASECCDGQLANKKDCHWIAMYQ